MQTDYNTCEGLRAILEKGIIIMKKLSGIRFMTKLLPYGISTEESRNTKERRM